MDSDKKTLLRPILACCLPNGPFDSLVCVSFTRFLGWVKSQPGSVGALDCSLFGAGAAQDVVEGFVQWCQNERNLSFGTIGNNHATRMCCDVYSALSGPLVSICSTLLHTALAATTPRPGRSESRWWLGLGLWSGVWGDQG